MEILIESKSDFEHVKVLNDRLDTLFSSRLKVALFSLIQTQGSKNIILDISNCSYCDASGLGAIVLGNNLCRKASGRLIVTGLQEYVEKLIRVSQLDKVFCIANNMDDAKARFFLQKALMN